MTVRMVLALVAVVQVLIVSRPALAYLDPGTGSILLQGLLASFAAGLAAVGLYWRQVKGFVTARMLRRGRSEDVAHTPDDDAPDA